MSRTLTRITLNPVGDAMRTIMRNPEAVHAIIAASTNGVGRPLYRVEGDRIYLLAEQADGTQLTARLGRPSITSVDYAPLLDRLREGQSWGFAITVNPTTGHHGVHKPITDPSEVTAWLVRRLSMAGARVDDVRIVGFRTLRFRKQGTDVVLHTADMQGTLKVTGPDSLRAAIVGGVGRGKAYGCGLLLLRRN